MAYQRAQVGIGMLILFIAALFVATIVATVLIQSNSEMQSKATRTGDQVRNDATSVFFVMDIIGTDGSDGDIEKFTQLIKLPPGSNAVSLSYLTLVISGEDFSASLRYRGSNASLVLGPTGYNTFVDQELGELGSYYDQLIQANPLSSIAPVNLEVDLDLDGAVDNIVVCETGRGFCAAGYDGTHLRVHLSTGGDFFIALLDSNQNPMGVAVKNNQMFGNTLTPIGEYGYITLTGSENDAAGPYNIAGGDIEVYAIPVILDEDLDDDGLEDSLSITDTEIIVRYSNDGDIDDQMVGGGVAYPLGVDLGDGAQALDVSVDLIDPDTGESFGSIDIVGTTSRASYIDEDIDFTVHPAQVNKGYYVAEYVKRSENYRPGVIFDGDMVRLHYELPRAVVEDEEIHIIIITHAGTTTDTIFYMPNIINKPSIMVYS